MAYWLFKQEPSCYSFSDLERDGETVWDGVANALALKYLRQVKQGDEVFFYHTGQEKAVVGIMKAVTDAVADQATKAVTVQVQAVKRLQKPVSLSMIKQDASLKDFELTRLPRLSIIPVTSSQWRRILAKSR